MLEASKESYSMGLSKCWSKCSKVYEFEFCGVAAIMALALEVPLIYLHLHLHLCKSSLGFCSLVIFTPTCKHCYGTKTLDDIARHWGSSQGFCSLVIFTPNCRHYYGTKTLDDIARHWGAGANADKSGILLFSLCLSNP